jgi:hypothetical protein
MIKTTRIFNIKSKYFAKDGYGEFYVLDKTDEAESLCYCVYPITELSDKWRECEHPMKSLKSWGTWEEIIPCDFIGQQKWERLKNSIKITLIEVKD